MRKKAILYRGNAFTRLARVELVNGKFPERIGLMDGEKLSEIEDVTDDDIYRHCIHFGFFDQDEDGIAHYVEITESKGGNSKNETSNLKNMSPTKRRKLCKEWIDLQNKITSLDEMILNLDQGTSI